MKYIWKNLCCVFLVAENVMVFLNKSIFNIYKIDTILLVMKHSRNSKKLHRNSIGFFFSSKDSFKRHIFCLTQWIAEMIKFSI